MRVLFVIAWYRGGDGGFYSETFYDIIDMKLYELTKRGSALRHIEHVLLLLLMERRRTARRSLVPWLMG